MIKYCFTDCNYGYLKGYRTDTGAVICQPCYVGQYYIGGDRCRYCGVAGTALPPATNITECSKLNFGLALPPATNITECSKLNLDLALPPAINKTDCSKLNL